MEPLKRMGTGKVMLAVTFALFTLISASKRCQMLDDIGRSGTLLRKYRGEHQRGVIPQRRLQQRLDVADCVWDGFGCSLRRDFVRSLPDVLGSPTTDSAKVLYDAALRAVACSNLTGQLECLSDSSCDWDAALSRCTLGSLVNVTALRGVAFCHGSPLDVAVSCASLSPSACSSSSSLNCSLLEASQLDPLGLAASGALGGSGGLSAERPLSGAMSSMLGTMVKYGIAGVADPIRQLLNGLTQLADQSSSSSLKVCVASWMLDSETMSELASAVSRAVQADQDLLTALYSGASSLTTGGGSSSSSSAGGSACNDSSVPLLAAVRRCAAASSSAACAAAGASSPGGCRWLAEAAACSPGSSLLPSLTLDSSDRWVSILNNATSVCQSLTNATSCSSTYNLTGGMERDGSSGGGGGGDGGAAAAARMSFWLLSAAIAVAVALSSNAVRRP